jgi:serine/threonine protein kinase
MNWSFDSSVAPETIFDTVKEIGKGGFGSVFLVKHNPSGQHLAGKIINPEIMDSASRKSFLAEIDLLKQIKTPYTIQYYGNIQFHGSPMILMEYCDRGSLRDMIDYRDLCLSEKQACIIIHDLLAALLILEMKYKVMHRDIKAANILINSKGQVKVTDFGVSSRLSDKKTGTLSTKGTPYWMAPEVINGQLQTYSADIWSVGATAIELIEGAPPYCEYDPTKAMIKIATNGFPGFRAPKLLTSSFKDFISKCMSRDPKNRCTAAQLMKHPWIAQAETLNREEILKPLTDTVIDFNKLNEIINGESLATEYSSSITAARNTLRNK